MGLLKLAEKYSDALLEAACKKALSYTASVGLLFHTFGGQYCIDCSVRIYANPLSPFTEAVTVPFQILLVVCRHMFSNGAVLPRASF